MLLINIYWYSAIFCQMEILWHCKIIIIDLGLVLWHRDSQIFWLSLFPYFQYSTIKYNAFQESLYRFENLNFSPVHRELPRKAEREPSEATEHWLTNNWHCSTVVSIEENTEYNVFIFKDHNKERRRKCPWLQDVWILMQFCCWSEKACVWS